MISGVSKPSCIVVLLGSILALAALLAGCASNGEASPIPTDPPTAAVSPSSTATASRTPTRTPVPTATLTPTFTPTPSPTALAGGTGEVIMSCETVGNVVFYYDLANRSFRQFDERPQSEELWHSSSVQAVSPDGQRAIWRTCDIVNPVIVHRYGVTFIEGSESSTCRTFIADISLRGREEYPYAVPTRWLPDGLTIYEEDRPSDSDEGSVTIVRAGTAQRGPVWTVGAYDIALLDAGTVSPDGRYFTFPAVAQKEEDDEDDLFEIILVDLHEQTARPLVAGYRPSPMTPDIGPVVWDRDSDGFIFQGDIVDEDRQVYYGGLYHYDIEAGHTELMDRGGSASRSPDGEWLAYEGRGADGAAILYLSQAFGDGLQEVPLPERYEARFRRYGFHESDWLPDGSGLLYFGALNYYPETYVIRRYDLESGETTELAEFADQRFIAGRRVQEWSPDGRWFLLQTHSRDRRFSRVIAVDTQWHICSLDDCQRLEPPGVWRCFSAHFAGLP